jgi:hypothetical protein
MLWVICVISLTVLDDCRALPQFRHNGLGLSNNSFIFFIDIHDDGGSALKCVTDSDNCCNNSTVGGWSDESGRTVYQGADGVTCLYFTRGDGVISLIPVERCRAFMPTLVIKDILTHHLVRTHKSRT